jgi:threonine synthase
MEALAQSGRFTLTDDQFNALRQEFDAFSASEAETTAEISRVWRESEMLIDPHTAVGVHAARQKQGNPLAAKPQAPMIVLGTAHAAKFPDAIAAATGQYPALPSHLNGLFEHQENMTILPNDQKAIAQFILQNSRAVTTPAQQAVS